MEYKSIKGKLSGVRISVASTEILNMKIVIRLESMPLFMELLQSCEN